MITSLLLVKTGMTIGLAAIAGSGGAYFATLHDHGEKQRKAIRVIGNTANALIIAGFCLASIGGVWGINPSP